jgi:hypothetical protein
MALLRLERPSVAKNVLEEVVAQADDPVAAQLAKDMMI